MENSLVVLHLLGKKQETCFWWYHTQIGFEQSEDVYRQKSYFHFRFNTNSGGIYPMQSIFYLKPQGHQIWACNFFFAQLWRMGPRCSSAETQVCHRSYIIAASVLPLNMGTSRKERMGS
jgi:hypothetical protein